MNILRRFGLGIVVSLFSLLLFVLALFVSARFVLDTPQPLESALSSSGIYNSFVSSILANQQTGTGALPQDPSVQQALQQALTPTYLQTTTEHIINSTYSWVHGNTPTPSFSIDLTPVKNSFASNITTFVQQKVASLPTCTSPTAPPTDLQSALALSCRPAGVSASEIAAVANQAASSANVLGDATNANTTTLTADTLKDSSGRSLSDRLAEVPKAHRYYILSLYIIPVALVLSGLAIIFWSQTRRSGLKHIARTLITTGILSIVIPIALVWFIQKVGVKLNVAAGTNTGLQTHIASIITSLAVDLRVWWVAFGVGYTLAGIIILIAVRATRSKTNDQKGKGRLDYARYNASESESESGTQEMTHQLDDTGESPAAGQPGDTPELPRNHSRNPRT